MRAGVIVAGGRSTRFGDRDKVLADLAGVPMIRWATECLAGVTDELVVNCRVEQVESIESVLSSVHGGFATDPEPDRGPMAGIHTGLEAVESEYSAVVAADMPFVESTLIDHLFDRAAGHDAAVPRSDGRLQPIQAVYRTEAMTTACAAALERGDRRLLAVVSDLDCVVVEEDEVREYATIETFTNINTREEFEIVAEQLSSP